MVINFYAFCFVIIVIIAGIMSAVDFAVENAVETKKWLLVLTTFEHPFIHL